MIFPQQSGALREIFFLRRGNFFKNARFRTTPEWGTKTANTLTTGGIPKIVIYVILVMSVKTRNIVIEVIMKQIVITMYFHHFVNLV
jgi:hypothetical protein